MSISYYGELIPIARKLRKYATPQENHLWYDFLSKYPIRFQRQKTIGRYIADFYCHKAKLIIEIDGSGHFTNEGKRHDELRTNVLNKYGLHIIRFTNWQIDSNFNNVCSYIDSVVRESMTT